MAHRDEGGDGRPRRADEAAGATNRRPTAAHIGRRAFLIGATAAGALAVTGDRPIRRLLPTVRPGTEASWVVEENRRPGTAHWRVDREAQRWERIRGYAGRTSVRRGETVDLFVSTTGPFFTVTAYRMGYYGGLGGRAVWTSRATPGVVQPPATTDPRTNLREADWQPSLRLTPTASWPPGAYLLKLTSSDGGESLVPLVVRDDRAGALHIQHDVTTWQAYNAWGGASLYDEDHRPRSQVVSFDRPYDGDGSGRFLGGPYQLGALVESLGVDVTYSTSIDTHERPELLRGHRGFVSPLHDEYWSKEMRDGLEAARDAGTNIAFLGANNVFRRIRLEPSPRGPSRRVVNYRVAHDDPLLGIDDERVTTNWREGPVARPESELTGSYFEGYPVAADMVIVSPEAWMFDGTGVSEGDTWPALVGYEYDRVTPDVPTPRDIQVLAHSPVTCKGRESFADMTYYTTDSGAGVFTAGTLWLARELHPDGRAAYAPLRTMIANVLGAFAAGPAGRTYPAMRNLEALGIHPGTTVPPAEPDERPGHDS